MRTKKFLLLIIAFVVLFGRLFQLMIWQGPRYRELSEGQRIRERVIRAPRGLIKDRNGKILARNRPIYKLSNCQIVKLSNCEEKIISHQEALEIEAKGGAGAAGLRVETVREYPEGEALAHLIGYTGEITEEEIANYQIIKLSNYKIEDIVGRMGVEEEYDEILRGVDGRELIETDASGRPLRVLAKIEPQPGQDLTFTIDLDLQKKVAELMKDKKGAVVVSQPKTGEILALYSSPSFEPNRFIEGKEGEEGLEGILEDPEEPLFNRAIAGLYPPGSVFKIITASAGLEEKVIDGQTEIEDVGVIQIGPYRYPNWYFTQYGRKEGMVKVVKAIQRSNDIFFYKVGEMVGVEKLAEWGRKFGIGSLLGIDLPGEGVGVMPDEAWKKKVKGEPWFLGDTYHLAIGQGNLLVTPLEVNFWTGVIVNGGKLCRPKVMKDSEVGKGLTAEVAQERRLGREQIFDLRLRSPTKIFLFADRSPESSSGSLIANKENFVGSPPQMLVLPALFSAFISGVWAKESSCQEIGLSEETISLIKEGMKKACEPGGTGWPLFKFTVHSSQFTADGRRFLDGGNGMVEIPTGCKTGTAEFGDPKGRTHAWFTVFAPFEEPEMVVTVLVEDGGEGSDVAAPIAKEILKEWFEK